MDILRPKISLSTNQNWRKINSKKLEKSGCEKEADSELLFGLGVNE